MAELVCAILLVAIAIDIIYTFYTRIRKQPRTQSDSTGSSDKPHNLGVVIACYMAQITFPTTILQAVHGIVGCVYVPASSGLAHAIFALLFLEFRTKAPGAHTIAQFVGHRFGVAAHVLTIFISLFTALYNLTINAFGG
ncbi:unnamed protein product [Hydatigera taeniaeformis]|uniref:Membrane spanning protein n=1 Tax=Hydatigena taeniaeformis TaxID=6205 RepID=A0A0R3XBA7_HYDTA|nr:unnamed protein product [Hydatigera taeniaeformis]